MTTVYVTHPRYAEHNLIGHPEFAGRLQAIWKVLEEAGLPERMLQRTPQPLDTKYLLEVHDQELLDTLSWTANQSDITMIDLDTYALPSSYEIARLAAGGVALAIDEVLSGNADNGLAAVRPPGHHAVAERAMGFCLINNIAVAARYAQKAHNVERVMIVDYDVHHGNGTQDIFYADDSVLFVSSHQHPFYPGSGLVEEMGIGIGKGQTLNMPLPGGHGDASYAKLYEEVVWPAAKRFKPQLILVSAGFDSHWRDPLAQMRLSLPGYAHLTRELIRMAETLCDGKIIFALEGGYDLQAVAHGFCNIAYALLGDDTVSDPYGLPPQVRDDVGGLIARIKQTHNL